MSAWKHSTPSTGPSVQRPQLDIRPQLSSRAAEQPPNQTAHSRNQDSLHRDTPPLGSYPRPSLPHRMRAACLILPPVPSARHDASDGSSPRTPLPNTQNVCAILRTWQSTIRQRRPRTTEDRALDRPTALDAQEDVYHSVEFLDLFLYRRRRPNQALRLTRGVTPSRYERRTECYRMLHISRGDPPKAISQHSLASPSRTPSPKARSPLTGLRRRVVA